MFTVKLVAPSIIEVREYYYTAISPTLSKYYYKDIKNWNDLSKPDASKYEKGEDMKVARPMHQSDIDWCRKYYIPKISL